MQHEIKQTFLRDRLLELFHKDTLDSFRVRIHNTNSLLLELKLLLVGWEQKRVQSFETVKLCAEDLITCLKNDNFISIPNYNRELFLSDLNSLTKTDGIKFDIHQLVYFLDKLLDVNKDTYIQKLFEEVEDVVFSEDEIEEVDFILTMERIDSSCTKLASELINIGYSKTYIYLVIRSISKKPLALFKSEFHSFRDLVLTRRVKEFAVIFKLTSKNELTDVTFINELVDHIDNIYLTRKVNENYASFIAPDNYSKFGVFLINAFDQFTAIKESKVKLSELFDKVHLGYNGLEVTTHPMALVVNTAEKHGARLNQVGYMIDGIFESNQSLYDKFNNLIVKINSNQNITKDVKDRLLSALRYLRLGNNSIEIEQRFIDYWIGLEFIFSFPQKGQSTYVRLKENIVSILSSCYVKRNFYILQQMLIEENGIEIQVNYWELTEHEFDQLIITITSPLLRFHIQKTKPIIFGHSDKRRDYITKHVNNLNQNVARIYHLRNELIHEAALKQDIENITSNLRYYLVFVLNQLITYFSDLSVDAVENQKLFTMDDMFSEYKMWKKYIENEWKLEVILSVPVQVDLIKKS